MTAPHRFLALPLMLLVAGLALPGCSTVQGASQSVSGIITPYRIEIVQGNFVSREQVEILRPGMTRTDVRNILGTPMVTSTFHADRWDYVFTIRRQGVEVQSRKLVVFFKGDLLERFEGDPMPSEAEFVAQLDSGRPKGTPSVLEASEEVLKKFAPSTPPTAAPAALPPLPASYPPLESPNR